MTIADRPEVIAFNDWWDQIPADAQVELDYQLIRAVFMAGWFAKSRGENN